MIKTITNRRKRASVRTNKLRAGPRLIPAQLLHTPAVLNFLGNRRIDEMVGIEPGFAWLRAAWLSDR